MLVKNSFTHDARVHREAKTLVTNGFDVTVIALLANNLAEQETTEDGINIIRVSRGLGSSLHAVSDPSQSKSAAVTKSRRIRALAIKLVKLAASTPLGNFVQHAINNRMKSAALSVQPNIMHAHDLDTLSVGVDVAQELDIPLIYDSHEIASQRNHHSPRRKRLAFDEEKKLINQADRIIMVSQGCAEYTANIYNIATPDVIMNCPDLPADVDQVRDLRSALNIPKSDFLVVHQGSLQRNRGVEQTIDAVSEISNCTLVIIGFGQHRPALEQYVASKKLDTKVKFFGPVPTHELIQWTASADLGIATIVGKSKSYLFSMPNKLFEYVMAGLPVIASNYPDMQAFVQKNDLGLTCDPESADEIKASINFMIDNPIQRKQFAEHSKVASKKYNWQVEQQTLLAIYNELLSN